MDERMVCERVKALKIGEEGGGGLSLKTNMCGRSHAGPHKEAKKHKQNNNKHVTKQLGNNHPSSTPIMISFTFQLIFLNPKT